MAELEALWGDAVAAAAKALWNVELSDRHRPFVELPQDVKFGDATTGVPMRLAKDLKRPPKAIAEDLARKLSGVPHLAKAEAAGGYVNFTADLAYYGELVDAIRTAPGAWGRGEKRSAKVLVEHTSANPTGPLHVAHARQAAVGDALSNIMSHAGYDVSREFYINDAGFQIEMLGRSIHARLQEALGTPAPFDVEKDENAYRGEYVRELAQTIRAREPSADPARCAQLGLEMLLAEQKRDLEAFRVRFDTWYSERALRASGKVDALLEFLRSWGLTYAREGATWMKSKEFGDVDDRVIVKTDGQFTYRVPDLAYHRDKFDRGFEWLIDLWGPDHHAEIANRTAGLKALNFNLLPRAEFLKARPGGTPETKARCFEVLIVQHSRLLRGGQEVKMSKRSGSFVTLRELMEDVGVDAARWFFTMRKTDSHMDFDLDVAKKQSLDNPVYYAQYAHARICSIYAQGVAKGLLDAKELSDGAFAGAFDPGALGPEEVGLLRSVRTFPRTVRNAADQLDPSILCTYLYNLSTALQSYYQPGMHDASKRVLVEDDAKRRARLAAIAAVQVTLRNGFKLVGVSAPERLEAAPH